MISREWLQLKTYFSAFEGLKFHEMHHFLDSSSSMEFGR